MATWAIGDLQGCLDELQQLLTKIAFNSDRDRLWFVGDLVNRGPQSLQVLRFVRSLGASAVTVLGNHDLHLLAVAAGIGRQHKKDTLQPILDAPDRELLLDWLRCRPLIHYDSDLNYLLVHAGLAPAWTLADAMQYAAEVEQQLSGDDAECFYREMYSEADDIWSEELTGMHRLRVITDYLTRLRFCRRDGSYSVRYKGPPGSQPEGFSPWFEHPALAERRLRVIFGHWSSLGVVDNPAFFALDSGCLWGRKLTAFCLDDPRWETVQCHQYAE